MTGVDDDIDDGNIGYSIELSAANSSDSNYNGEDPLDVGVTNIDDDEAGFTLSKTTSSITESENDSFTVVLDAQPQSNVVIDITSDDIGAVGLSLSSLTFTNGSWNIARQVEIEAVDDPDLQDETPTITVSISESSDDDFDALAPETIAVTITDDDEAGFTLSKTISTIMEGESDTFTVVLDAQPQGDVVIDINSDDTGSATASPTSVTFTNGNWNVVQTVTISAVDDADLVDETPTITASINASSDDDFDVLPPETIAVTITDDDEAGFTLSKSTSSVTEGGSDSFTVVLDSRPQSDVVIDVGSDDPGLASVSPSGLTFTSDNWSIAQTVTITSLEDPDLSNESITLNTSVNESSDTNFANLEDQQVVLTIEDNDEAGYTLSKTTFSISEGSSDEFTVVLRAQPENEVIIDISSDNTEVVIVSPASLTFSNVSWDQEQTVTISSLDDSDLQDVAVDITTSVNPSSDGNYTSLPPESISVSVSDDDEASFSLSSISGGASESGNAATFTIVLDAKPISDVSFEVTSDNLDEAIIENSTVIFTADNWGTPQTVRVIGIDDNVDDGDVSFSVIVSVNQATSDDDFDLVPNQAFTLLNEDDDTSGISVGDINGNTTESGDEATFAMTLDSEPIGDVRIGLSSTNTGEGIVSPPTLIFTSANWDLEQVITVSGVDDDINDGDVTYSIVFDPTISTDDNYNGLNLSELPVVNVDDENTTPVISGQVSIPSIDEDSNYTISLDDLTVEDDDSSFPDDFTLIIESGSNYEMNGLEIIPIENFNGELIVNIRVSDGIDESELFAFQLNVLAVNDKPILSMDMVQTQFGTAAAWNILTNDSDIENNNLTLTSITPLDGLSFEGDGTCSFTGFSIVGTFVLDYIACDDGTPSECAQSTVTITVNDGDLDSDGIPDSFEIQFDDVDNDGSPEYLDTDSDDDGILDNVEAGSNPGDPVDTDLDGTPDFVDFDSDNDSKTDLEEGVEDCDRDHIPNYVDNRDDCDLKVSSAFSPNGDGINDEWLISGIEAYPNNTVIVFNRSGTKVFEMDDYDNNGRVWRGEINTGGQVGTDVPYSTYYFVIDFKDGSRTFSGNVLISR